VDCGQAANCSLSCSAFNACNLTRFDRADASANVMCDSTKNNSTDLARCYWNGLTGCAGIVLEADQNYPGNMGKYMQTGKKKNGRPVYKSTNGDKFTNCGSDVKKCNNDCYWASDGHCDDGGLGSIFSECEMGTDCADCTGRSDGDEVTCSDRYLYYKVIDGKSKWVVEDNAGTVLHKLDDDSYDPSESPKPPALFWETWTAENGWAQANAMEADCDNSDSSFYMDWETSLRPDGDLQPDPDSCENPQFCSCQRIENEASTLCALVYGEW